MDGTRYASLNKLKQRYEGKRTWVMETLQKIVQQVTDCKTFTLLAPVSSAFIWARSLSSSIKAALNAMSREPKRHHTFNLWRQS